MKKIIIVVAAALTPFLFNACGGASTPKSEMDSVAYSLGIDIGTSIRNMDSTLNINVVAAGLKDAFTRSNKFEHEDAVNFLREYYSVRKPAKAKAEGEAFLADIANKNPNVQRTESGLYYEIITPGDQDIKAVSDQDKVVVNYEGKLRNDRVFDSSYDRGEPAEFPLTRVIKGWSEGLKLVGKGGKIKLYIPSDLAYGEYGQPRGDEPIGPNEPLVFDIEVIDVIPHEAAQE